MVLFGIGGACGFVPTLPAMERGVKTLGPNASDAISGAYWTLYYLGEGVGPFMGALAVLRSRLGCPALLTCLMTQREAASGSLRVFHGLRGGPCLSISPQARSS